MLENHFRGPVGSIEGPKLGFGLMGVNCCFDGLPSAGYVYVVAKNVKIQLILRATNHLFKDSG